MFEALLISQKVEPGFEWLHNAKYMLDLVRIMIFENHNSKSQVINVRYGVYVKTQANISPYAEQPHYY